MISNTGRVRRVNRVDRPLHEDRQHLRDAGARVGEIDPDRLLVGGDIGGDQDHRP
jgi:hypothetical protein